MRKLFTILVAITLPLFACSQAHFEGDSIKIDAPFADTLDFWQVNIQNLDALNESVQYWTCEGNGTFYSPWCNVRVSRTGFNSHGWAIPESWHVDLKKVDVHFSASAMPNRKVQIQVFGGEYDLRVRHIAYGNWYGYQSNGGQYFPTGHFQEGERTLFVPYRIKGVQVVTATIHAGGCSQKISRIVYLN